MLIRKPEQDIERVLFTEKAIAARVEQLGADLTAKLGDKRPVLVCVLKGASFFYIDLCRCMNCAIDMDFIAVSSYGASAQSTGVVRLIKDLDNNITAAMSSSSRTSSIRASPCSTCASSSAHGTPHPLRRSRSWTRRRAIPRATRPICAASRSRTNSSSATASITQITTAISPTSAF